MGSFSRSHTPHRRGRSPKRTRPTDSSPVDSQYAGSIEDFPPHERILERRKRRDRRDVEKAVDDIRKGSAADAAKPKPPAEPFSPAALPAEPAPLVYPRPPVVDTSKYTDFDPEDTRP
ncbi:TPA: hypothetical protein DEP96_03810 [Candidatus Uhrbacteria bacterium]|nr:hypothetical protein [Candidatus Uhrbacteria bacterium]